MNVDLKEYDVRQLMIGIGVMGVIVGLVLGAGLFIFIGDETGDNGEVDVTPPEEVEDDTVYTGTVEFTVATEDAETSGQELDIEVEIGGEVYEGTRSVQADVEMGEERQLRQYTVSAEGYEDSSGSVIVDSNEFTEEIVVLQSE